LDQFGRVLAHIAAERGLTPRTASAILAHVSLPFLFAGGVIHD
jgi:hypothetical protein